ncbi:MAG TPA: VWA domain-containing protein [Acidimicrobiia bacterium]|jgi:Mg-chelatase subunit ChlD
MRLQQPWLLLVLIPALGAVVLVARHGRRSVPSRQNRVATFVRSAGVVLLVLALTQPLIVRTSGEKSVLFLLDRSASITAEARAAQEVYVRQALALAGPQDRTAVAVFGREIRLDQALSSDPAFQGVNTVVDDTATDLGVALRGAAAVLPTEGSRRIVVLTDGVETSGDAREAAREISESGIAVDILTLETGRSSDALITRVDTPVTAREGEEVPVEITVQSSIAGPAVLVVEAGGEPIRLDVDLVPGTNRFTVEIPATESGPLRVRASIETPADEIPENDQAEALVRVLGPARVAVVEGKIGEGGDVARALEASGMRAVTLNAIPGPEDLLTYDGIVLVNVPNPGDEQSADLAAFVEELGRGLVVVGGDQSYGLGDYHNSALEELLPVTSDPDDLIRRQPIAEVLVIDTSGSMADCHCGDPALGHNPDGQLGYTKTSIAQAGAGLAIGALQPEDRVGVLAFTSGTRWALPLAPRPDANTVASALATLTPEGDTEIAQALRVALEELRDAPEEIKHMVLFTDGWGDDVEVLTVAQEIAEAGITLSVLGTGEGSGESLRRMASLGGGQFYPGRDLESVPEIFVEETLRVSRPLIAEGAFLPTLGAASQVTAGLTEAPPLLGYVLTRAKSTASIPLEVGPGDPLLASWQRGLGRATAWTSDATARWSVDWLPWQGFVDFWGKVVSDVLPPGLDNPPEVRLSGGGLDITYEADVPLDAVAIANVRDSTGNVRSIALQRTGESTFAGRVPVTEGGAYWVAVQVENASGTLASGSNGVVAGYADEFAFRDPDPGLALDVTDVTEGRVDPAAADVFDPAPAAGAAATEIWSWLVAAALVLFMADIVLRRLIVSSGDFAVWKETLTPTSRAPVEAIRTDEPSREAPPDQPAPPRHREVHPEEETFGKLLRRKRKG